MQELASPPAPTGKGKRTKGVGRSKLSNFNPDEDVNLVKAWLDISLDPINGTSQKKDGMWLKILEEYNLRRESYPESTMKSLQCRLDVIKAEVGRFASFYADVLRENPSGMSDADMVCDLLTHLCHLLALHVYYYPSS